MHPAYSVILFTTASGAGYGLLFLLGVFGAAGVLEADRWFGFAGFAVSLGLVTLGLLSSTFHLGHPERAWRAFSQWRSSWLSREGVAAVATYLPAGLFALGWVVFESTSGLWGLSGALAALGALATVTFTGMIYQSLTTIRQWCNGLVTPLYLALALASGSLLLNALAHVFGLGQPIFGWLAAAALGLGLLLKLAYWRAIDAGRSPSTAETATGLGHLGKVRMVDPPHSQDNYVMREMGYRVGRKHAATLRIFAVALGFAVPLAAVLAALLLGSDAAGAALAVAAVLSAAAGLVIERWLFFAEATHVVMLYYGAEAA